jgi:hypothetical protein
MKSGRTEAALNLMDEKKRKVVDEKFKLSSIFGGVGGGKGTFQCSHTLGGEPTRGEGILRYPPLV